MVDPITRDVIKNSLEYIAEEMGIVLRNSAYSSNIKERMDHSCAVFDSRCRMLAHAEHIPVHLGAMPFAVREAVRFFDELSEGDMILVNDPFLSGTHLPDLTLIAPVFEGGELVGYVANRAHHSDIGGKTPGSMPGDAIEIFEEGLIIPPVKIVKRGNIDREILRIVMANVRTPRIRKGDILAQIAANLRGIERLRVLVNKYGAKTYMEAAEEILNYTERLARSEILEMPKGASEAEDFLDDGGVWERPIRIHTKVTIEKDRIIFDFSGTDDQVRAPVNAPRTVTLSAIYFVFKCIIDPTIPSNEGTYRPVKVITRRGSVVDAEKPYAVVGGNVETSQRIVDVAFRALAKLIPERIPAASQGTMNNIAFGGMDPRTGSPFTFYETIGGGFGARPNKDGVDGVHSHMTNTMNTPIEEIERNYPIRILKYGLRENSCGAGMWRGGLGIERIYEILAPMRVSLLGDRQKFPPWGLNGGLPGATGEYILRRGNREIRLRSKTTVELQPGDILIIRTPGGGGYGDPARRDKRLVMLDILDEKISMEYAKRYYGLEKAVY